MSFWSRLFGKSVKESFLEFTPFDSQWIVVTWNFDSALRALEIQRKEVKSIRWTKEEVQFFKDKDLLTKDKHNQELKDLMNLAIHSTLKYGLEENRDFMLEPVAAATTMDIQNESKSLLWVQASFETVTRALDKFKEDPSLLVTAAFFSGIEPASGDRVTRLMVFNLDIFYYMRPDQTLQIVIFDDKDRGHGSSKSPRFQQIIKVTKPQFYDEIVRLVHRLAVAGELK